MHSAEGLIFLNENFGFGLMSKILLQSYSGTEPKKKRIILYSIKYLFKIVDTYQNSFSSSIKDSIILLSLQSIIHSSPIKY